MKNNKPKVVFETRILCPCCKKLVIIKKTKKTITAAVPAVYEEKIIAEKDSQTTLKK